MDNFVQMSEVSVSVLLIACLLLRLMSNIANSVKAIDDYLECRCIVNVEEEEEEAAEVETGFAGTAQLSNPSYMPYGIDGPRITITGASSVLMRYSSQFMPIFSSFLPVFLDVLMLCIHSSLRYTALLKTDTSYPLKILYSVHKDFDGYRVHMLMPPPSPLRDIIKVSPCSTPSRHLFDGSSLLGSLECVGFMQQLILSFSGSTCINQQNGQTVGKA